MTLFFSVVVLSLIHLNIQGADEILIEKIGAEWNYQLTPVIYNEYDAAHGERISGYVYPPLSSPFLGVFFYLSKICILDGRFEIFQQQRTKAQTRVHQGPIRGW